MRIDVLTIFPEMFAAPLDASMVGIARESGTLQVGVHDLRDWTEGRHRQVDDTPYGGGPGMVMKPEPFFRAVGDLAGDPPRSSKVVLLTPQGPRFDQATAEDLATRDRLLLLCGRYEGFDERIRTLVDAELSVGDYVLSGGELAAMIVIDAVARLLPGVLGHEDSAQEESFSWGLLEYPQYTRPAEWAGLAVPEVLLSGDHARIAAWRRARAIERTARSRPDMLDRAGLTGEEREHARRILEDGDGGAKGPSD